MVTRFRHAFVFLALACAVTFFLVACSRAPRPQSPALRTDSAAPVRYELVATSAGATLTPMGDPGPIEVVLLPDSYRPGEDSRHSEFRLAIRNGTSAPIHAPRLVVTSSRGPDEQGSRARIGTADNHENGAGARYDFGTRLDAGATSEPRLWMLEHAAEGFEPYTLVLELRYHDEPDTTFTTTGTQTPSPRLDPRIARGRGAGGPLVLMGIDAEDGGPNGHGPIQVYADVVDSILASTRNGGEGILVFGAGKRATDPPTRFWNAIAAATGEAVTLVNGAANITEQSLEGFEMIAVVSAGGDTYNGLNALENEALVERAADVASFVNAGGGLLAFSATHLPRPYGYLDSLGDFAMRNAGYSRITPTDAGREIGITDALDVCCWHNEYTSFPDFLEVLATIEGSGRPAVIGGVRVVLPGGILLEPLDPSVATQPVGTEFTGIATLSDRDGPLVGQEVAFLVESGPNVGTAGTALTDSNGQAVFTYAGNGGEGIDVLTARFTDAQGDERSASLEQEWELVYVPVPVDIKPTSCRNPFNAGKNGMLPVAVLGTRDLDVAQVDAATVALVGVAPERSEIEDVAAPYAPFLGKQAAFDCTTDGADGFADLTFKFDARAVSAALGEIYDGDVLTLRLTGRLLDGTEFVGEDVIVVLSRNERDSDLPLLAATTPNVGPTEGGTVVTLTGENLADVDSLSFGGQPVTRFTVDSDAQITATAPAGHAGTVNVTAASPRGASNPVQFTYVDEDDPTTRPTITAAEPRSGPTGGGTTVTLTGARLAGATAVTFGAEAAASFTIEGDTRIVAVSPAADAGTVGIKITTPAGTSNAIAFTYHAPPTATSIAPAEGPTGGETPVTITGARLSTVTDVYFGDRAASFIIDHDGQLTALSPSTSTEGTVEITLASPYGINTNTSFSYYAPASLTGIEPARGSTLGGDTVLLTGSDLAEVTSVHFGNAPATSFIVESDSRIRAVSPVGVEGTVDVTVASPYGASGALSYTYVVPPPVLASISPASGLHDGGTQVTITGRHLDGTTAVHFGDSPATSFGIISDTRITAVAPAGNAGPVDVTVTTRGGVSDPLTFTYLLPPPAITSIDPAEGLTTGGTQVTITGTHLSGVTAVSFGSVPASSFTVESDTRLVAVSPAGDEGTVGLTVASPDGTSNAVLFLYAAPPNQPPFIGGFGFSPTSVGIGQTVTFTWSVDDPDGNAPTCLLDFGDGRQAQTIVNCDSENTSTTIYLENGAYTATLQVIDDRGASETAATEVHVEGETRQVNFDDPAVQVAWRLVQAVPGLDGYSLNLHTPEALVLESGNDHLITVPDADEYKYLQAGVVNGRVTSLLVYSFDLQNDQVSISNVLDTRSVLIQGFSRFGAGSADPAALEELSGLLEPLFLHPAFDQARFTTTADAFLLHASAAAGCSGGCSAVLSDYNIKVEKYAESAAATAKNLFSLFAVQCAPAGGPVPTGVLLGAGLLCGASGYSSSTLIYQAGQALDAFDALVSCVENADPTYSTGTALIAVISPPLPFSNLRFVQSLPERINLASGSLAPDSSLSEVASLLESAIGNAEVVFQSYSGQNVIPGATQIDAANRSISTSYETGGPPRICEPDPSL